MSRTYFELVQLEHPAVRLQHGIAVDPLDIDTVEETTVTDHFGATHTAAIIRGAGFEYTVVDTDRRITGNVATAKQRHAAKLPPLVSTSHFPGGLRAN